MAKAKTAAQVADDLDAKETAARFGESGPRVPWGLAARAFVWKLVPIAAWQRRWDPRFMTDAGAYLDEVRRWKRRRP
jgi:hypothetical protein